MNNKPEEQHIWEAYRSYDGIVSDKDSLTTLDRDRGGKGTQIGKGALGGRNSVRGEASNPDPGDDFMDITRLMYKDEKAMHPVGDDKEGNEIFRVPIGDDAVAESLKPGQPVKWRNQDMMARFELWYMGEVRGQLPGEITIVGKITPSEKKVTEDMDDMSHGQFTGDPSVEPMSRMEPQEAGGQDEPRPSTVSMDVIEKGSVVKTIEGAVGEVVDKSDDSPYGIIELLANEPKGELQKGDRMTVHFDDLERVADSVEEYEDDVPWDESAARLARQSMDEDCGCGGPEPIHGGPASDMGEPHIIKIGNKSRPKKKTGIPSGLIAIIKKLLR